MKVGLPCSFAMSGAAHFLWSLTCSAARDALNSPLAQSPLYEWTNPQLALALLATTIGLIVAAQLFYRWSVNRAWKLGKIEETTGV